VIEAVRLLAGKGEDLLCTGSEVVHHKAWILSGAGSVGLGGDMLSVSGTYDPHDEVLVQEASRNRKQCLLGCVQF
jgi:hypothetical protein